MKKIVQSATLGGAPIHKNDLRESFSDEIWDSLEAMLSPFNSDTEGIIVSGCVISANASNFDMTAGIVYLNGEFMRIAAATNQSFTKYIAPATVVDDDRQFADGTTNTLFQTSGAELVVSAPGAGQYITINSLTGAEDRRVMIKWARVDKTGASATESAQGIAEIATQSETNAGVDDARIVTPAKLRGNPNVFRDLDYTTATNVDDFQTGTIAHASGSFTNAPSATAADRWIILTIEGSVVNGDKTQMAIQTENTNAGNIYVRTFPGPSGPWGSWSAVNT